MRNLPFVAQKRENKEHTRLLQKDGLPEIEHSRRSVFYTLAEEELAYFLKRTAYFTRRIETVILFLNMQIMRPDSNACVNRLYLTKVA